MYSSFVSFQENYNRYKYDHPKANSEKAVVIPGDLLTQIFSLLNPRDLAACSRVSKAWNTCTQHEFVWKSLYQRFVPNVSSETNRSYYKTAVRIIYANFSKLQKELAKTEKAKLRNEGSRRSKCSPAEIFYQQEKQRLEKFDTKDHQTAISGIFTTAIRNRIFFLGHSLLKLMETEPAEKNFLWELAEEIRQAAQTTLYLTMLNRSELTRQVLTELKAFFVASREFVEKKCVSMESLEFQELRKKIAAMHSLTLRAIIESVFVDAVLEKNLTLVTFIEDIVPKWLQENKEKSIPVDALSVSLDESCKHSDYPQNKEIAKFFITERIKKTLFYYFDRAVRANDIDTAKRIIKVTSGNSVVTNDSLNTLFRKAIKNENKEMAEFIRGLGIIAQDAISKSWQWAKKHKMPAMKAYLKPLLEKKDCVIS